MEIVENAALAVGYPWFALQVRMRHEALVTAHLNGKGYEWFLPLYKSRKRWSDRVKETELPLFPGYLFCRFDPQNRLPILKTPGVTQIVGYNNLGGRKRRRPQDCSLVRVPHQCFHTGGSLRALRLICWPCHWL